MVRFVLAWMLLLGLGCAQSGVAAPNGADKILHNGTIYTMDSRGQVFEAVALQGDRILAVGDESSLQPYVTASTEMIDLEGSVVFPGFIDTHIHTMDTLPLLEGAMLSPSQSAEEVLLALKAHVEAHPEQNPVLGSGFLARAFGVNGPTAAALDRIVGDRPALIIDEGGHTAWANTKALELAGITADTPDPVPGAHFFQRDSSGRPTGWLVEGAAIDPVSSALGLVSEATLRERVPQFFRTMSSFGLTAAFDAGMIDTGEIGMAVLKEMAEEGTLPVRIVASLYVNRPADLRSAQARLDQLRERFQHEFFTVSTLKLSLDGTVEAKTAVTLEPYLYPEGHTATPLLPRQDVINAVIEATSRGVDLHLHAIGDGAVRTALDAVQSARERFPDTPSRYAICHVEVVDPADTPRFAALDVVAQVTPTWFEYDYVAMDYLGEARFNQLYPIGSILRSGAKVTFGSDYPVSWIGVNALNPLYNIEMAVTRQQAGNPDYPIQARIGERLSVDQALRAHTIDAAWQIGLEAQIGSIEPGKQADLVILERDPYRVSRHDIHSIRVQMTVSDGRVVYVASE